MFYNGFNLMIDLILCFIVYRFAFSAGYARGEDDYREDMERYADYAYESRRDDEY